MKIKEVTPDQKVESLDNAIDNMPDQYIYYGFAKLTRGDQWVPIASRDKKQDVIEVLSTYSKWHDHIIMTIKLPK